MLIIFFPAFSPSDAESAKRQMSDLSSRLSMSDGLGHEDGESIGANYPEYQQLPDVMKLAIFDFLQERISVAAKRGEGIDPRIALLAEEVAVRGDVKELREEHMRDPKTTILHIACSIGHSWLVELQIKAGVDIHATDAHNWTSYMVAYANQQNACEHLLLEQMKSTEISSSWGGVFAPSKFFHGDNLKVEPDGLTITAQNMPNGSMSFHPNHPIPPSKRIFYFEITVLHSTRYG